MRVLFVLGVMALFEAGCAHVAPYDRGALARLADTGGGGLAAGHVKAVQEGATGGGGVGESGCGCN